MIIMLAGLQGAGKTTLAESWTLAKDQGSNLLVAPGPQRPQRRTRLSCRRRALARWALELGNGVGDPRRWLRLASSTRTSGYDVVVVDTAGRLGVWTPR